MSLPHAILDFDEQGIISPVGYNDSGKSAVTRSLEVLWFDAYTQSQVKFITDGQPSFVIKNLFDDGVLIQRTKYANGQSYWLMQQGDKVIYTNKLPSGTFAATKGVPEAISNYLGVVQDVATGETLNVRRNTDKLLLVATTGGENYKIFNNICQGDRLAYAVSELNKDVNAKNRELSANMSRLQGKKEVLAGMHVFSEEAERNISRISSELSKSAEKLAMLTAMAQQYEAYSNKTTIPEVSQVDITQLRTLQTIRDKLSAMSVTIPVQIPEVPLARLQSLLRIHSQLGTISGQVISPLPIVDVKRLNTLQGILNLSRDNAQSEAKLWDTQAWLEKEHKELRELAIANSLRVCPNCGAIVGENDTCEGVL